MVGVGHGMAPPGNGAFRIWAVNTHDNVILGELIHAVGGADLHGGPGSAGSDNTGSLERRSGDCGALHFP